MPAQSKIYDVFGFPFGEPGYELLLERIAAQTKDLYNFSHVLALGEEYEFTKTFAEVTGEPCSFLAQLECAGADPKKIIFFEPHVVKYKRKVYAKPAEWKEVIDEDGCHVITQEPRTDFTTVEKEAEMELPVSCESEEDALGIAELIKNGDPEKGIRPGSIKTLVLLHQSERFLPLITSRCNVTVYQVHEVSLDGYTPEEREYIHSSEDGIVLRDGRLLLPAVELRGRTFNKIEARPIDWLYPGYLPRGMAVTIFAPKGRGKTKICDYFTAVVSSGRDWADGQKNVHGPQHVLRFNLEDPEEAVLKPSLIAAGACLENVTYVEREAFHAEDGPTRIDFTNPAHILALKRLIQQSKAALVIIEPVNNYKGKAKSISEDDMRPIFMALSQVAKETGACILVINHANKKRDVDVLEKSLGAGSGPAVARMNWFLEKNPHNKEERMLTDAGSNLPAGKTLVFTIKPVEPFEIEGTTYADIGRAVFVRTDEITGDELLEQTQSTNKSDSARIAEFLKEFLRGKGDVPIDQVRMAAHNENPAWAWDNVKQVFSRKKIGISRTEGGGKNKKTFWSFAEEQQLLPTAGESQF